MQGDKRCDICMFYHPDETIEGVGHCSALAYLFPENEERRRKAGITYNAEADGYCNSYFIRRI